MPSAKSGRKQESIGRIISLCRGRYDFAGKTDAFFQCAKKAQALPGSLFWHVGIHAGGLWAATGWGTAFGNRAWRFPAFPFSYPPPKKHIHNQDNFRGVLGLKTYIEERAVEVAKFMIHTNATVRETAKKFGISKSTVHMEVIIKNGLYG